MSRMSGKRKSAGLFRCSVLTKGYVANDSVRFAMPVIVSCLDRVARWAWVSYSFHLSGMVYSFSPMLIVSGITESKNLLLFLNSNTGLLLWCSRLSFKSLL